MAPNCSVLMCISRLLGSITWGKTWTLLYSTCYRLPTSLRLVCFARLHCTTIPFRVHLFHEAIGYSRIGIVFFRDWIFRSSLSLFAKHQSQLSASFRHTYSKGDIYYPKYAWTAFPRLVCAEGYIVPGRLNSEVPKSPYTLVQLKVALGFICDRLNLEAFPCMGMITIRIYNITFTKTNSTWLSPSIFNP